LLSRQTGALRCGGAMTESLRKKILFIDDDSTVATVVVEDLAERGFEVAVAHDGHEGFISILKTMPDLVLCDVNMPVMSGIELLDQLNALAPRLGRIPFVFLTALADRDSELRARRLGADDYVTKPIDFERLELIINARTTGVARNNIWPKLVTLSDREIEALTWVARGKTSAEVADVIGLSKRTVDFHLDNARLKLGAATRTEAAIKAAIGKLIEP
jgi:DNA-binding NarL/FixJ family response regulator